MDARVAREIARRSHEGQRDRFAVLAVIAALAGGCGGSSKPAYCGNVQDFKSAVQDLKRVDLAHGGRSELVPALQKVESTGKAAADAVKSEFGAQADAVTTSLATLGNSVRQLANPQQTSAALVRIPDEANAVKAASDELSSTTKSKCD